MESYFDKLIKERRSIRKYTDIIPSDDLVDAMIKTGSLAPSPSNSQPVRIVRIQSVDIKNKLRQSLSQAHKGILAKLETQKEKFNISSPKKIKNLLNFYFRHSEFMFEALLLFAVGITTDVKSFSKRLFEIDLMKEDKRQDTDYDISTGLFLKGFLLKATELGIGTCILSAPLDFIPDVEKIIGVDDVQIKCFVTAGYPDEKPVKIQRKKTEEIYRVV